MYLLMFVLLLKVLISSIGAAMNQAPPINDPKNQTYLRRLPTALDLFLNALFGGQLGETLSSRIAKGAIAGNWFAKLWVKILDLFQAQHELKAPEGDEIRSMEVVEDLEKATGVTPNVIERNQPHSGV